MGVQRNLKIDLLRIIAAFMVVVIHVAAQYWDAYPVSTYRWMSVNFYDSLGRPAVPIFLMISGMFLLNPSKKISFEVLWKKYIKRILILFVLWSTFYATWHDVFWMAIHGYPIAWKSVFMNICRGHYHLWYCILLFGIYLLLPILKKIAEEDTLLRYFLVLTGVFLIGIPWIHSTYFNAFRQFLYFSFGSIFVWYFMMGYYLQRNPLQKNMRILSYGLAVLGFAVTFFGSQWKAQSLGMPYGYYDPQMPGVVLMAIGIFVFFQHSTEKSFGKLARVIQSGAACSLGIYLIHPFILSLLDHLQIISPMWHLAYAIPLKAALVFAFSWISIGILRKIPFIAKIIV